MERRITRKAEEQQAKNLRIERKEMEEERKQRLEQYRKDEPTFEKATVLAVLTEMEQWNSII